MNNIRNNKGITIISLILTTIVILILTGAMIYNTKNQLEMKKLQNLFIDIENLNSKIDEYYLKYGELPILCDYTSSQYVNFNSKDFFIDMLETKARAQEADINIGVNNNDGDEYGVIDLEKLGSFSLNFGYDLRRRWTIWKIKK